MVDTELFIGGKWVPASSGSRFDVRDPATGDVIASVADGGEADAIAAVDAAAEAGAAWAATPPRVRGEALRKAWELMTARSAELAKLISLENGKALVDAKGEVTYAAEFFRWFAEEAVRGDGLVATAPSGANRILVVRQPVGVCVLVTPWKHPTIDAEAIDPRTGSAYPAWKHYDRTVPLRAAIHHVARMTGYVCVMDWASYVEQHPERLHDGIHPDALGREVWARMLKRTINACTS